MLGSNPLITTTRDSHAGGDENAVGHELLFTIKEIQTRFLCESEHKHLMYERIYFSQFGKTLLLQAINKHNSWPRQTIRNTKAAQGSL